ncbi:MAG: hypothetical protein LBO05_00665 [Deltaproteobacteria bacterium]|jgi:hypothetical protein|nr:hypothetical protein [Deltaproteobacteria bacterium]
MRLQHANRPLRIIICKGSALASYKARRRVLANLKSFEQISSFGFFNSSSFSFNIGEKEIEAYLARAILTGAQLQRTEKTRLSLHALKIEESLGKKARSAPREKGRAGLFVSGKF